MKTISITSRGVTSLLAILTVFVLALGVIATSYLLTHGTNYSTQAGSQKTTSFTGILKYGSVNYGGPVVAAPGYFLLDSQEKPILTNGFLVRILNPSNLNLQSNLNSPVTVSGVLQNDGIFYVLKITPLGPK